MVALFWLAQAEVFYRGFNIEKLQFCDGIMFAVVGIVLRATAILTLGRHLISDISVERVVRTGVDRWMRHPSEIGLLLIAVGVPLILGSAFSASLALLLLTPISLWRIRREEAAIHDSGHTFTSPR